MSTASWFLIIGSAAVTIGCYVALCELRANAGPILRRLFAAESRSVYISFVIAGIVFLAIGVADMLDYSLARDVTRWAKCLVKLAPNDAGTTDDSCTDVLTKPRRSNCSAR